MKILSIDTSSNICGVSILENSNLICKLDENAGKTHSENLMPMIQKAFFSSKLNIKDIDLLVCDKGPGSFTGIRIGIATIKAFSDSLAIPCIGVSSLKALAYNVQKDGLIASILDCKNDNCYFALYEQKNSIITEITSPSADTITNALKTCKNIYSNYNAITFVGNGVENYQNNIVCEFKNCNFELLKNNDLNSYHLGLAGLKIFENKNIGEDVLPLYLKKCAAQTQLEEKLKDIEITNMTLNDLKQLEGDLLLNFDDFWTYTTLENEIKSENSNYIVAKINQNIIGFAGIKLIYDESNIMNIVVKKDFRNQGVGSLLLENLLNLSKQLGCNTITLEVMEENYPAIHLYKKFAFEETGLRKNYYKNKNGIIMTKK